MSFLQQLIDGFLLLITSGEVWDIAGLSLFVSVSAVILAVSSGVPLGIYLSRSKFKGARLVNITINTGMGLPPVFVGLVIYLMFARSGPLGNFRILFTPLSMIFAQFLLTLPIVVGVTRSRFSEIPVGLDESLISMGADDNQVKLYTLMEARSGILTGIILALGRAFSEVGAIIIVGGNIRYHTRVLTTAIITEISKGENEIALAMGLILISISLLLNGVLTAIQMKED